MKQKDIGLIAVVVIISGILSIIISGKIISTPSNRQQQVEVVQSISSNFNKPSSSYFNASSYDPTQIITIGPNSNSNPF